MYIIAPNTFQKLFPIRIVYSHFLFNRKEKGLAVKIALQKKNCISAKEAECENDWYLCKNKGPRAAVIKKNKNTCLSVFVDGIFNLLFTLDSTPRAIITE